MKTAVKLLAVLFVGLPLWFLAWRGYEEWRVRAAYREFLADYQKGWSTTALKDYDGNIQNLRELWDKNSVAFRSLGLRHPTEWK